MTSKQQKDKEFGTLGKGRKFFFPITRVPKALIVPQGKTQGIRTRWYWKKEISGTVITWSQSTPRLR